MEADVVEQAMQELTRGPEVDYLLLADRAEVVNNKLYVMGGGWDQANASKFPHTLAVGVAVGLRIVTAVKV